MVEERRREGKTKGEAGVYIKTPPSTSATMPWGHPCAVLKLHVCFVPKCMGAHRGVAGRVPLHPTLSCDKRKMRKRRKRGGRKGQEKKGKRKNKGGMTSKHN